jgi:hypothetical protein
MRRSRRGIVVWTALAAALVVLGLVGAVGASAHEGKGSSDGAQATETRGHDQEQEPARQEDRSVQVAADDNGQDGQPLLRSTLAPSMPADPAIAGVAPGGLPWQIERGSVLLQSDGRIRLSVKGLVIPASGTTGPVQTVTASLACADGSKVQTTSVPISSAGDATIDTTITLPSTCLAPVVLVNPNGIAGVYIAVTGWR